MNEVYRLLSEIEALEERTIYAEYPEVDNEIAFKELGALWSDLRAYVLQSGGVAVEQLCEELDNGYWKDHIRVQLIESLPWRCGPRAVESLCRLLEPSWTKSECSLAAAKALRSIRNPRPVRPLCEALEGWRRQLEREGMSGWRGAHCQRVILNLVETLGHTQDSQAVPTLCQSLQSDLRGERLAAVVALGTVGDPCAVGALRRALADDHEPVQQAAAVALTRMKASDPRMIEVLCGAMKRADSPEMRRESVDILGQLAGPEVLPLLKQRVQRRGGETDKVVLLAVREAIRRIAGRTEVLPASRRGEVVPTSNPWRWK